MRCQKRDSDTRNATDQAKYDHLTQDQSNEISSRGAKGSPDRDVPLATGRARNHEITDVRASNEQNERHRSK